MRCPQVQRTRRNAFTLLELLVVMAIILVLVSLIVGAAFRALSKGYQLRNRSEIAQLDTAVQTFQTEWNVDYMPSTIALNDGNPQSTSSQFLSRMFRRLPKTAIAWNGSATATTLQGQHCLVFFLGGIQTNGMVKGFSTNPQNPADMTAPLKAPLFEFDASRLKKDSNGFLYYMDTYKKQPYAYFSAGRTPNGYSITDCSSLSVKPYLTASGSYWRPDSWQIISAGDSGKFGAGNAVWGTGAAIKKPTVGWDNQANFAANLLANP